MNFKAFFTSLALMALSSATLATDWELQKTEKTLGIEIYTRDVADSPFKEYKGVTHLESSLKSIVALLDDAENLPKWMYNMVSSKSVKTISPREYISYSVNKTGPFMDDRDSVVHSILTQDEDTKAVTITMSNRADFLPNEEGRVRISELNGFWKLTPKEDGLTEVVYQLHVNPAGSLPQSLVNAFVVDEPLNTLTGMHQQIGFYQDKSVSYITE